jgi:nucleotide-binding universal stress UspA family protein
LQPMDTVAESRLAEFLAESIADRPDLQILQQAELRLAEGLPAGRIVEMADLLDARLIVLGSRGISKLSRAMQGSVARKVVSQTSRTVAVIKSAKGKNTKARTDG